MTALLIVLVVAVFFGVYLPVSIVLINRWVAADMRREFPYLLSDHRPEEVMTNWIVSSPTRIAWAIAACVLIGCAL